MQKEIYLDNAATTPVYPEVVKAIHPYFTEKYGNPSSLHKNGELARKAIDEARRKLAEVIKAKPWEIIFTSGATESNNLAINVILAGTLKKRKIIISSFEHASVYEMCMQLKRKGYEVVEVPVDAQGLLNIERLKREIDDNTAIVSIIHGHNELGVIQNLRKIGDICRRKKSFFIRMLCKVLPGSLFLLVK